MEHLDSINYLYSLSGLIVGVLIGMTGVGGGSLMTPALILIFGIHPETAVAIGSSAVDCFPMGSIPASWPTGSPIRSCGR